MSPPAYVDCWSSDLGSTLEAEDWMEDWQARHTALQNISALETTYKVLSQWYFVQARIAKYVLTILQLASMMAGAWEPIFIFGGLVPVNVF